MKRMTSADRENLYQSLCAGKTREDIMAELAITPAQFATAYARLGEEKASLPRIRRKTSYCITAKGLTIPAAFFAEHGVAEIFSQGTSVQISVQGETVCITAEAPSSRDVPSAIDAVCQNNA